MKCKEYYDEERVVRILGFVDVVYLKATEKTKRSDTPTFIIQVQVPTPTSP